VVDGFIFKSGSPTIGFYNVKMYDHPVGPGVTGRTSGLFARKILGRYSGYPFEDDQRLRNRKIRDDFLTKVFIFAGWREAAGTGDADVMRAFHERNRYLFMSYDPDAEAALGRMLSGGGRRKSEYFQGMKRLVSNARTASGYAGLAMNIFERYRNRLSSREAAWFHELVAKYRKNKVSREGLLEALELFAVQVSDGQMTDQTLFAPYPPELIPDADEDRDRDYRKVVAPP
jgi:uncharacterized protein YbgA (DUF1722 family)